MKNGLLKLSAISLILGCSAAFASDAASLIPAQKPGFSVSITGLYLSPSASNLNYAIYTTPLPVPAPNWYQEVVNPNYSGAFDLALQYNLMNGRENVKLDWLHFNSKDSSSATSGINTSVGPTYYYGPAEQFLLDTSASSTVKFDIEHGNLIFGHLIDLSNRIQLEPFFGLSAVYLQEKISNNYVGTDPLLGAYSHAVHSKSTFTGFGPRIGFNGSYYITNHFAIIGNVAGDLLAGEIKYNTNFTSETVFKGVLPHNNVPTTTSMANKNSNRIVPEMDAELAMLYKVAFEKGSEMTLKLGYMYAVYFNAVNQALPTTLVPGAWEAGTVAIVNQSPQQQSNVDLRGPFVSFSWKF